MKRFLCTYIALLLLLLGCEEVISVPDISEDLLTIIAPSDGATLDDTTVTFSWEELEFVDQYQLQIVTPTFDAANQVVLDTIIGDSIQSFRSLTTTLSPENYQWRIRGLNSNYQTDYVTQSITVEALQIPLSDQSISLLSPEDNVETSDTMVTFSWEELEDASLYRIQILNTTDNSIVAEDTTATQEITIDLVSGTYIWQVRGESDTQNTSYTTRTITIL